MISKPGFEPMICATLSQVGVFLLGWKNHLKFDFELLAFLTYKTSDSNQTWNVFSNPPKRDTNLWQGCIKLGSKFKFYMRRSNFVGHQRVIYQLATSHETLAKKNIKTKKNLPFPEVLHCMKGDFQNKILSRVNCKLHWSWILWILWCKYHMRDRVGEYGLESNIWVIVQHEELENS